MRTVFRLTLLTLLALTGFPATAQEATPPGLFDTDDVLHLTLTGDLRAAFRDTHGEPTYHPATLSYTNAEGDTLGLALRIKARGHFRRLYLDCDVPPLRLNFKKKKTHGTVFAGQDKLKLVTHCDDHRSRYEQYVLQEYLTYRAYNLLTDHSFRARLVRITYHDTSGKRKPVTRFGFLIEDEKALAYRLGGHALQGGLIHQEDTDRAMMTLTATFQYMIGNTDWTVPRFHNVKIILTDPHRPPVVVPYDFDFAGLLNTPYAKPDERLRLRDVRMRLYRGYCRSAEAFDETFARFLDVRDDLYALFTESPHLTPAVARSSTAYLDGFYETITNPRDVRRTFLKQCQRRPRGQM